MRLIEAREGFIKLETEKAPALSSFLQVKDTEKSYIAQVIKLQKLDNINLVFAKLLYLYDGSLINYDSSLPTKNSEIIEFSFDIINQSFKPKSPIVVGKFFEDRANIVVDSSFLNKKTLVSFDNSSSCETFISNIKQQVSKNNKFFVVDMQGIITSQKFVAGKDFRLPLNTDSLNFLYEDCLNDATSDSKSLIKEIFNDLSEYSKTVNFLPFGALKSIVDEMVEKSHIFKLLVLKNKLNKFDKMGYFALDITEAENLDRIIASQSAYLDLSKLDPIFQNRYLETFYNRVPENATVCVIASNSINKRNLKTIITNPNIASTFITHSRFKYIKEIKSMFKNFVIEPTFSNNEVFKHFASFLNYMPKDAYLFVGEATNNLPIISILEKLPDESFEEKIKEQADDSILEEIVDIDNDIDNSYVIDDVEKDENTIAIEEKSEKLIQKINEELENENISNEIGAISLFEDEEENNEEDATNLEIEEDEKDDEQEEISLNSSENEEYHTVVDTIKASDLSEDEEVIEISEDLSEEIIEENNIEIAEEVIELEETEMKEVSEEIEEISEIEEEIIVPDDIELEEIKEIEEISENQIETPLGDNEEIVISEDAEIIIKEDNNDESIIMEDISDEIEEVVELDESEFNENDIIVEIDDDEEDFIDESVEQEIMEDVDKVFTTMKDETLSDNDLDLIDELNNEVEEIDSSFEALPELSNEEDQELDFVEPIVEVNDSDFIEDKDVLETKKTDTTIIPVYDAEIPQEDMVVSDTFDQGDVVTHAKYGTGVVEKMIKYGNKTLFSINFENVGRRLLDPTLTEIKKS